MIPRSSGRPKAWSAARRSSDEQVHPTALAFRRGGPRATSLRRRDHANRGNHRGSRPERGADDDAYPPRPTPRPRHAAWRHTALYHARKAAVAASRGPWPPAFLAVTMALMKPPASSGWVVMKRSAVRSPYQREGSLSRPGDQVGDPPGLGLLGRQARPVGPKPAGIRTEPRITPGRAELLPATKAQYAPGRSPAGSPFSQIGRVVRHPTPASIRLPESLITRLDLARPPRKPQHQLFPDLNSLHLPATSSV